MISRGVLRLPHHEILLSCFAECPAEPAVASISSSRPLLWQEYFGRPAPLDVEIGFGFGEFLIRSALENLGRDYVGIEQNGERICKTLKGIAKIKETVGPREVLSNIRLLKAEARIAIERFFNPETIDRVYCLFPCPWPKKAHIRHRLFTTDFLKLLNSRLKPQGTVIILTDFFPYVQWIEQQLCGTGFGVARETVMPRYDTKFERKWRRNGQEEFSELTLTKERHCEVPLKEDAPLKAYDVEDFCPERFCLEKSQQPRVATRNQRLLRSNQRGDVSVIFKEMIFDSIQEKAMIHVVVAEPIITQHFWIAVFRKGRGWRIGRADGQNLLPTEGLACALEMVYEAVVNGHS